MATNVPSTTLGSGDPTLQGLPTDPRRVRAFAAFFKSYMSIWTVLIAALPAPVTALRLIPTYEAHRYLLSVYTPLFCFLLLGFIFFSRHAIGRRLFYPESVAPKTFLQRWWSLRVSGLVSYAPMLLVCASFVMGVGYLNTLAISVLLARVEDIYNGRSTSMRESYDYEALARIRQGSIKYEQNLGMLGGGLLRQLCYAYVSYASSPSKSLTWEQLRKDLSIEDIPLAQTLQWRYLMIFLTAEAAFIMMAIKEYLQDVLQISDVDLIRPKS